MDVEVSLLTFQFIHCIQNGSAHNMMKAASFLQNVKLQLYEIKMNFTVRHTGMIVVEVKNMG